MPTTSATKSLSKIPEELRQQIIGELNYDDAWALKQTSWLFVRVVGIPTIRSFIDGPTAQALQILREWDVLPRNHELSSSCYSEYQTVKQSFELSSNVTFIILFVALLYKHFLCSSTNMSIYIFECYSISIDKKSKSKSSFF